MRQDWTTGRRACEWGKQEGNVLVADDRVRLLDRGARSPRGAAADPEGSSDPNREPLGDDR
jgi:hypothetical protein